MKIRITLLFLLVTAYLPALTWQTGNVRIQVDDKTGSPIIYSRLSPDNEWIPLLVDSPSSTYIGLYVDGNEVIINGNREFLLRMEEEEKTLALIFDNNLIRVEQRFSLREPQGSAPYLLMTLSVTNGGSNGINLGIKSIWDTRFNRGETHFYADGKAVGKETAYSGDDLPGLILSAGTEVGQKLYFNPLTETPPDRLVLANWNRLDREGWDYAPQGEVSFSDLPFSVNDSAIALYLEPQDLAVGESAVVKMALGASDFSREEKKPAAVVSKPLYPEVDKNLALLYLEEQLAYLNELLEDLDELLTEGDARTNDKVLEAESRLNFLEKKKREYEALR